MKFNVNGVYTIEDFPGDISGCYHLGACDDDVDAYLDAHGAEIELDRADAIRFLAGTGGWTREELAADDARTLLARVVWLAAGTFHDGEELFTLDY